MRCVACDTLLKETELHRRDEGGDHLDLCNKCYYSDRSSVDDDIEQLVQYSDTIHYYKEDSLDG